MWKYMQLLLNVAKWPICYVKMCLEINENTWYGDVSVSHHQCCFADDTSSNEWWNIIPRGEHISTQHLILSRLHDAVQKTGESRACMVMS